MKRWEYTILYIAISSDLKFLMQRGKEVITGNQIWEHINTMGLFGWELVTVVERIGDDRNLENVGQAVGDMYAALTFGQPTLNPRTQHKPVTLGYFYHFKRERQDAS